MEKKHFKTLFKKEHKFYGNEFVEGKVSGFQSALCDNCDDSYAIDHDENGKIFEVDCTEEQYAFFKAVLMDRYPDMLEFDYKG